MLRFLKGFTIVAILVAIILPGMRYFLSSKITLMVNQWIANISPYARVSYENIDIDLAGAIKLRNATVDVQYGQQPNLKVQRISIRLPELYDFYQLVLKGDYSLVPDSLAIELQGMNLFFLDSPHLAEHYAARNKLLGAHLSGTCEKNLLFGPTQLKSMGYTPSTLLNFGIQYRFHDFNQTLDLSIDSEIQGLGFITLGMSIDNVSHLDWEIVNSDRLGLKQLSFLYQDDGYIPRRVQYCAQRSGVPTEEYITREASQDDRYYAALWGVIPGASIRSAYQQFLYSPQTISINLGLQSPFRLDRQYWKNAIPVVSQLYVSVNNEEIIAPELNIIPEGLSGKLEDLRAILSRPEQPEKVDQNTNNIKIASLHEEIDQRAIYVGQHVQYKSVELTSLTTDERRQVKITLSNGRQHEGFIVSLNEKELQLKSLHAGGEVVMPVKLERISLFEIMMQ